LYREPRDAPRQDVVRALTLRARILDVMNRLWLHRLVMLGMLAMAATILWVTLTPDPPHLPAVPRFTAAPTATGTTEAVPSRWTAVEWDAQDEEAVGHSALFVGMGAFAALWVATLPEGRSRVRGLLFALIAVYTLGGLTELAQGLTATRTASLTDLEWDAIGGTVGVAVGWLLSWVLLARTKPARR